MRKLLLVIVLAIVALVGAFTAPKAQAQEFPDCSTLTPFTPAANFMSIPGWLCWQYLASSGRWVSRDQAVQVARDKGCNVGPAPTG